ncbi:MAG: hypothetical protein AVDCRST_MAG68-855, partial [uncultured Gemmatimonadetes bacterium]
GEEAGGARREGPHPPDPPPPNCWGRGAHSNYPAAAGRHRGRGCAGGKPSRGSVGIAPSPVTGRGGRGV